MKYTTLNHSDIKISRICLGTMTWGTQNTQDEGHAQMDYALDQGVNFWDTAEMYSVPPTKESYGNTETIIGTWLASRNRRDEVILATKISPELPHIRGGGTPIDRKNLIQALDESMQRLQTDYIDLYQLHWPTNRSTYHFERHWNYKPTTNEKAEIVENKIEILQTLDEFVKQGKVRAIGLSDDTAWGVTKYADLAEQHNLTPMSSLQNEYSLLRRRDDTDVAEACSIEGIGYLAWSPLAMGVLSGKYLNGNQPQGTRFTVNETAKKRYDYRLNETVDEAVSGYVDVAKKHGLDPCQMAIAFTLTRPFITSSIVGATSIEQLENNLKSIDVTLSEEALSDIEAIRHQYPIPF